MIECISLENFKSHSRSALPLGPLTLLIGANASGKSNALEAIRLLNWLANGSRLDDIERGIEGAESLVRGQAADLFRPGHDSARVRCRIPTMRGWNLLELELSLLDQHLVLSDERVISPDQSVPLYAIDGEPNPHTDEISVLYNNFKRGRNKPHVPCSNRQAVFYQLQTPGRFNKDHAESQECIPAVTKLIREALQGIQFLEPRPSAMRDYAHAKLNQLKEDGSNLSGVLYSLCQDEEATSIANRQAILDFIRSLPEQDIEDVDFIRTERNDVMVRLKETFGGQSRTVDAPLLSDGTLRVLAVAAALLSADKGSLVIIEEIDNGIHPSRADKLVAQIEKIARRRDLRVLLTSHNPALLDALPVHALADVLCCYRDPDQGYSSVVRLGDLERYPELIAQGPLGQLMTDRVLDRFIKDKTTNAQRKQRQFSWLEALEDASAGQ